MNTERERRWPCEDGSRNWGDAATSKEISRISNNYQKIGSNGRTLSRSVQRNHDPADTLISDFWLTEL